MSNGITLEDFKEILKIKGTDYIVNHYKPDAKMLMYVDDIIDWNVVSTNLEMNEETVEFFNDKINFNLLNLKTYFHLSEFWLNKNSHLIDFEKLSYREDLTIDFIREFKHKFYWNILCLNKQFLEQEIEEFIDYVHWSSLTISHQFSEDF